MDRIQKLFASISKNDRILIQSILEQIFLRNFSELERKKLKGYEHIFRIRVKNYRIIYFDDGNEILLKAIRRRNERTYRGF